MGFLERMVCDMVKQSTGYNPRKLVRAVGGKNLLAGAVGAALAGGLISKLEGQPAQASSGHHPQTSPGHHPQTVPPPPPGTSAVTPPPPPTPSANVPPPPPPAAQATPDIPLPPTPTPPSASESIPEPPTELPDPPPEVGYAILRAMASAALSDGSLDDEEKAIIEGHLAESNLSDAQQNQIRQDLVLPPSPSELATETTDPSTRESAYRFAAIVLLADQKITDLERRWLERLAEAYQLPAETRASIEANILNAG